MRKSLLFSGLVIVLTMLCCYALVTADVVHQKKSVTTAPSLGKAAPAVQQEKAPAMDQVREQSVMPMAENPNAVSRPGREPQKPMAVGGTNPVLTAPPIEKVSEESLVAQKLEQEAAREAKDLEGLKPPAGHSLDALDCSNAVPISCGQTLSGNNTTGPMNVSYYNCSGWTESGPENVYVLTLAATSNVTGTLSGMSCDNDIFFLTACDENQCIAYGDASFNASNVGPGTFYIVVDRYGSGNPAGCAYTLAVTCTPVGGPGGTCANPVNVTLPPATWPYVNNNTTCGMGNEYTETCLGYYDGGEDIIYRVTVTSAVTVMLQLTSTASWVGMAIDDACPPDMSCIGFCTTSGSGCTINNVALNPGTYYIMIDTWPSPNCIPSFTLTIDQVGGPLPGEDCAGSIVIPSLPYSDTKNTCLYSYNCGPYTSSPDVFYRYDVQAPNEMLTVSLLGSSYDTYLYIWSECCVNLLAYNDDFGGTLQSQITGCFSGTIWIEVAGYSTNCGTAILNVTSAGPCPAAPPNDNCADAIEIPCGTYDMYVDLMGATPDCEEIIGNYNNVWYKFYLDPAVAATWNVSVSYCGTDPAIGTIGANLQNDCLCDDFFGYSDASWGDYCIEPSWLPTWIYFYQVPAGWWNLPVYTDLGTYAYLDLECTPFVPPTWDFEATVGPGAPFSHSYNTCGAGNDCYFFGTEDVIYQVTILQDGQYQFSLCNSPYDWDADLYLSTEACGGTILVYDDMSCYASNSTYMPKITCQNGNLVAGVYYLTIEGYYVPTCGDYLLEITYCEPVVVECPPGGIPEGEPCPPDDPSQDWYNGGCNFSPPPFSPIACGQTMCGTCRADYSYRDLDWYQAFFTEPTYVYWDVLAEFQARIWIIAGPCPGTSLGSIAGDPGTPLHLELNLSAGEYYFVISTNGWWDQPCADYVATLSCEGGTPCTPDFFATVGATQSYTNISTTCGAGNDCVTRPSEDHIYEVTILDEGQYKFSLCNSAYDWDSYIYLDAECCGSSHLAFNDDACDALYYMSEIECMTSPVLAPGTYYLLIEAFGSTGCGDYQLDIEPCEECVVECPPGGVPEGEPCPLDPDTYNGGCNSSPYIWSPIECWQTVCGTGWANTSTRDTDWYEKTFTEPTHVVWRVTAEFPLMIAIIDPEPDCSNFTYIYALVDPCVEAVLEYDCDASNYWFFVAPSMWYDLACSDYVATLECGEAPPENCMPCADAIQMTGFVYDHDYTTCFWNGMEQNCLVGCHPYELDCMGSQYLAGPKIFYKMTLSCETTVDILCTPDAFMDPQLMIFTVCPTIGGDEDCQSCVASSDTGAYPWDGMPERIIAVLGPGTYYLSVDCYQNAGENSCGSYHLHATSTDCPLPVELTTLEAIAGDREVSLKWGTASEQDNARFDVQRKTSSSDWMTVGSVEGAGNSQTAHTYAYTDRAVVNGVTYTYRLISHDINGTVHEYETTVEATPAAPVPTEYALAQNYPNPFNPQTSISYAVKEAGFVTLKVYNLLGQEVANLVSAKMEAGRYTATFTATDLPSGVYVYRLEVNDFTAQKKMVLLK